MNYVASLFTTETNISNLFLSPFKFIKYLSHELYYLPSESLTSNLQTALGFCQRSSWRWAYVCFYNFRANCFDGQNNFFAKKVSEGIISSIKKTKIILSTSLFWLSVYTCTILQIQVHHIRLFYANNNITECTIISDFR